jgi:hypothetical protein
LAAKAFETLQGTFLVRPSRDQGREQEPVRRCLPPLQDVRGVFVDRHLAHGRLCFALWDDDPPAAFALLGVGGLEAAQLVQSRPGEQRQPHHLEACGVDLFLDQQSIDTTTPAGKLMFQITGAFAEFERSMIRQRVKLGLKRAKAQGKRLGRPAISDDLRRKAERELGKGHGIIKVAKAVGLGVGTVARIKADLTAAQTH